MMIQYVTRLYFRAPVLLRLFLVVTILILTVGLLLHSIEPSTFPRYFDAIWWAVITVTTVGYGDFVPESVVGRLFAILLVLFGFGFVTFFVTNLAASTIAEKKSWKKGTLASHFKSHYIIIGWNERSKQFIQQIKRLYPERSVVLIDNTLTESPFFNDRNFQFIKGNPTFEQTLEKANAKEARALIVTAGKESNEQTADAQSILTLLAAKHCCENLYTAVEVLTEEQFTNARHAGADEIITSNFIASLLMTESLEQKGIADAMILLLDAETTPRLRSMPCPDEWIGLTFETASGLARQDEKLLLGMSRNGKTILNPPGSSVFQEDDSLFLLTSESL